jgi:hypothetical protein
LDYYIDERSEELEKKLKRESRFAECRVKRQHWGGNGEYDTFVIQDNEGKDLLSMDIWEIDALSDSELVSIIDVNKQLDRLEYLAGTFLFMILSIILIPIATIFPIMTLINPSNPTNPISVAIGLLAISSLLLYAVRYFRKRNKIISEKQNIDLVAAQENSTFLAAMRRLASTIYKDEWRNKEYRKRLHFIEDALGIESS